MLVSNTMVYCTVLFEGVHCWPECPFEEVSYLRDPHRHVFYIKAYKKVFHDDRDVEFILLKHKIEQYLHDTYSDRDLGSKSCEMLASELLEQFDLCRCDISEDNENGAIQEIINY